MLPRLLSLGLVALATSCVSRSASPAAVDRSQAVPSEERALVASPDDLDALPPVEHQDEETRDRIARMEGYFPDPLLTTEHGEKVHFYEDLVRGKCVLIQFMYTSCEGT